MTAPYAVGDPIEVTYDDGALDARGVPAAVQRVTDHLTVEHVRALSDGCTWRIGATRPRSGWPVAVIVDREGRVTT